MNSPLLRTLLITAALAITACTSANPRDTEVTRFHLNPPVPPQTLNIRATDSEETESLEFSSYKTAVVNQLNGLGFAVADNDQAEFIAIIDIKRGVQQQAPKRSPFSIGIGGGSFGGNVGVGGSVNVPVGGERGGEVFVTELFVQLVRRDGMAVAWEGRAVRTGESGTDSPVVDVQRLAAALFSDYPGESGKTVKVP